MQETKFGKRKKAPVTKHPASSESWREKLKITNYVGYLTLCALALLLISIIANGFHLQNDLLQLTSQVITSPAQAAEYWILKPTMEVATTANGALNATSASYFPIRSIFVTLHQASLIIGLGGAFFLDLYLAQFLYHKPVSKQTLEVAHFGSRLVAIGLFTIWISGIAILTYYYVASPVLLENPKIWGKLFIVAVLTVNGILIHRYALPSLKHSLSRCVLDGDFHIVATQYLSLAAISVVSWSMAFLLGAFKELNNIVSADTIILSYIAAVAVTYFLLVAGCWLLCRQRNSSTMVFVNYAHCPRYNAA